MCKLEFYENEISKLRYENLQMNHSTNHNNLTGYEEQDMILCERYDSVLNNLAMLHVSPSTEELQWSQNAGIQMEMEMAQTSLVPMRILMDIDTVTIPYQPTMETGCLTENLDALQVAQKECPIMTRWPIRRYVPSYWTVVWFRDPAGQDCHTGSTYGWYQRQESAELCQQIQ